MMMLMMILTSTHTNTDTNTQTQTHRHTDTHTNTELLAEGQHKALGALAQWDVVGPNCVQNRADAKVIQWPAVRCKRMMMMMVMVMM